VLAAGERQRRPRLAACRLWEEYESQLDSNFADMANIGGRGAGAITAACLSSPASRRSCKLGAPGHRRHGLAERGQ
jgi:hypothetical protein